MDITVILCTYNPTIEELVITLDSIVNQRDVSFEIVISDDGSKDNHKEFIEQYFLKKNFNNYKLRFGIENKGTVVNIIEGLKNSEGKYIKTIGQGDLLKDELVLHDVVEFMEKKEAKCIFSKMDIFESKNGCMIQKNWTIPMFIKPWKGQNSSKIKENVIVFNDQISGASIFFQKEYCFKMMNIMKASTKYMEDLFQYIALLEGDKILYFDRACVLYECSGGISNSLNEKSINRMKTDKNNFLNYVFNNYPEDDMVRRRRKIEEIEKKKMNKILKIIKKMYSEPKWFNFRMSRLLIRHR